MADLTCPECAGHLNYGVGTVWADDGTAGVYACSRCRLTYEDHGGRAVRRDGDVPQDGAIDLNESAWYPRRLHTLEVRMEHDTRQADDEALSA